MSYRSPALTGDLTLLDGEVTHIDYDDPSGQPVATVHVVMTNQKEEVLASGDAEIRLPTEAQPPPVE
jgi:hypothetical protein